MDRLYQEILDSGRQPLIIDCGANIGCSALWFSARYPKSHIFAIEPAPDNLGVVFLLCRTSATASFRRTKDDRTDNIQVSVTIDQIRFEIVSFSPFVPGLNENNAVIRRVISDPVYSFLQITAKEFGVSPS